MAGSGRRVFGVTAGGAAALPLDGVMLTARDQWEGARGGYDMRDNSAASNSI